MQNLMTQHDLEALTVLACPACRGRLFPVEPLGQVRCGSCRREYNYQGGIWRFLLPQQQAYYHPFLQNYRPARQADGWERADESYYLNLPEIAATDPQAPLWRLRRRSYALLMQASGLGQGQYALDLGSGCGWLSRRLAEAGWRPLAFDLNLEGGDGLEGGAIYLEKAGVGFVRGQAAMHTLPLKDQTIALGVANGSFHYTRPELVLPEIYRVLIPGGLFIINDSPVYTQAAAGRAMVSELAARLQAKSGVNPVWPDGEGYLLLAETQNQLEKYGFEVQLRWPERPWSGAKRAARRLLHPGSRQQARFPLFLARK